MQEIYAEPYKIKMVEFIHRGTQEERQQWIKDAKYNLFNLRSNQVYIDLLTDSGTGAMSDVQWSEMMVGDESYAGASSYFKLKEMIENIMGFPYFLPTHQGRAAENVLFSVLVKEGDIVPGNSHFDTTKGHIEFRKAIAKDCTIAEAFVPSKEHPFKGNIDVNLLDEVITNDSDKITFIILTVTNNTAGGQPVSMENIKAVSAVCKKHGKMLCFDSARFAENAYFIKQREEGYADKSIKEIVKEMYSYADMATMSAKKDAVVNMGGFIGLKSEELFQKASMFNIMFEGYLTYGGMSGRDMNALAVGLDENTEFASLNARINQVEYLGNQLIKAGIPIQLPVGGHAIFIDAKAFLPKVRKEEYQAQTLSVELYLEAGIRVVEIGTILADRDPQTRENRYPKNEFVRLAIPRRTYTNNHMDVVANAVINVWKRRENITSGYTITREAPIMRHFTVELEKV